MTMDVWPFIQSFGSLSAPPKITAATSSSTEDLQKALIAEVLGSQHFAAYPPSEQFQRTYWKAIIDGLEASDQVRLRSSLPAFSGTRR